MGTLGICEVFLLYFAHLFLSFVLIIMFMRLVQVILRDYLLFSKVLTYKISIRILAFLNFILIIVPSFFVVFYCVFWSEGFRRNLKQITNHDSLQKNNNSYWIDPPSAEVNVDVQSPISISSFSVEYIVNMLSDFSKLTNRMKPDNKLATENVAQVVMLELFTASSGNHFVLIENDDRKVELNSYSNARAMAASYFNLSTTLRVNAAFQTGLEEMGHMYNLWAQGERPLWEAQLRTLRDIVQAHVSEALSNTSGSLMRDADDNEVKTVKTYFPISEIARRPISKIKVIQWLREPNIRKFIVHNQFLATLKKPDENSTIFSEDLDYLEALAIFKAATKDRRISSLYSDVLEEYIKKFDPADDDLLYWFKVRLKSAILSNPDVQNEVYSSAYQTEVDKVWERRDSEFQINQIR